MDRVVPVVVGLVVVLRLSTLLKPESPDEGGYLVVAAQWHSAGPSLYSHYWVDRPPLLIALFQLASALGGLHALRLLGAVAAGLTVVGVAAAARGAAGRRAAAWSAVVAGALLVSPLMGTDQVNGELLAAPFVAAGIAFAVTAARATGHTAAGWAAAGAGACAVAALLVKQNMAEVGVFAVVSWLVAWRMQVVDGRRAGVLALGAVAGALAAVAAAAGWTVAHGTSLTGVYDAMYPFRLRAAEVIATQPNLSDAHRMHLLLLAWAVSATPLVMLAFVWSMLRGGLRGPVAWGLLATMCYSVFSMLAGGGSWDHYLVELIVPVAIAGGLLAVAIPRPARALGILVVSVAACSWVVGILSTSDQVGVAVGTTIRHVARPGDTMTSAFGNAEVVASSGLSSPYPYLWTLPAQTLDPQLGLLERTITGTRAPTWFVPWNRTALRRLRLHQLNTLIHSRYHRVGRVCGRPIYLRDGVRRARPHRVTPCVSPSPLDAGWHKLLRVVRGQQS